MKSRRCLPKPAFRRLKVPPLPLGWLLASTAAMLPVCVHTAAAATRTYATDANGNFSAFPDNGQTLRNGDFAVFNGVGSGAATTVNSNVANLTLGTGVGATGTINGNAISFGLPSNSVPTRFTILQASNAPSLNIAGNVFNNSGALQTISTNLVETLVPKSNNVYGYVLNSGVGGLVINGTIGTGTPSSPGTTADLRKLGVGTLALRPPVSGGNNLGTDSFPTIGSLVDSPLVSQGTLLVDSGATLAARVFASVGYQAFDNGALTVNGTFTEADTLNVGDQANSIGAVVLNAGGSLSCTTSYIGKSGNGSLYISGGDFSASGYTSIGTYGGSQGTFTLDSGTYTDPGDFNVADVTGSAGTLTVNNGVLQVFTLYVGKGGGGNGSGTSGTLTQNGGYILRTVDGNSGNIEWRIGGGNSGTPQTQGTYNMKGGALQTSVPFQVGAYGVGTLNLTGGTLAVNSYLNAGRFPGGNGTINVTGGTLNQSDAASRLFAAESGTGVINVGRPAGTTSGAGGTVIASGGLVIGYNSDAVGTFNLNAGGLLQASYVSSAVDPGAAAGSGTSTFNFNGGTLQAYNSGPVFNGGATFFQSVDRANVQAGGAVIDTVNETVEAGQSFLHDNASGAPTIDGGLTKLGGGTLIVDGYNTYTGPTLVGAGTLQVYDNDSFGGSTSTGAVTVASGARLASYYALSITRALTVSAGATVDTNNTNLTVNGFLGGSGTVNGAVIVPSGGTLGGPLTINGALTVANGAQAVLTSGGTLRVNGNIINNGFMLLGRGTALALASGSTFTNNGTLDVSTGAFTAPAGFVNRGILIDSSVVRVRSVARQANGAVTLTISTYTGHNYRLQRATALNAASFADVAGVAVQAGSTGTTATFTDPSPPAGGSGFYRIAVDP